MDRRLARIVIISDRLQIRGISEHGGSERNERITLSMRSAPLRRGLRMRGAPQKATALSMLRALKGLNQTSLSWVFEATGPQRVRSEEAPLRAGGAYAEVRSDESDWEPTTNHRLNACPLVRYNPRLSGALRMLELPLGDTVTPEGSLESGSSPAQQRAANRWRAQDAHPG